jgi:hypothetical protein
MRGRRAVRSVGLLALSLACAYVVVGLVGKIDWAAVVDALGELTAWQVPVLLVVLVVRQVLNASPLALFIEGLGWRRAVQNDQAATLMSTIAPPPADMVLRLAMLQSWGVPMARGVGGTYMNVVTFYSTRFTVPLLGLLVLLATPAVPYQPLYGWSAAVSALVAAALLVTLLGVMRRETIAAWVGRRAGQLARRVRRSVDPEVWVAWAIEFRSHVVRRVSPGLPISLALLILMVVVDGWLLALSVRFVGVPAAAVPMAAVEGLFLVVYPLTLFPLAGLGVLDAVMLAGLVDVGGLAVEPDVVAGLVVYRVTTLLVPPLLFGLPALLTWRRAREPEGTHHVAG